MRANGEVVKTNIIYIISASIFTFECLNSQLNLKHSADCAPQENNCTNDYYFWRQTWL